MIICFREFAMEISIGTEHSERNALHTVYRWNGCLHTTQLNATKLEWLGLVWSGQCCTHYGIFYAFYSLIYCVLLFPSSITYLFIESFYSLNWAYFLLSIAVETGKKRCPNHNWEEKVVFDWTKSLQNQRQFRTNGRVYWLSWLKAMEYAVFDVLIRDYLESICSTGGFVCCHVRFVFIFVQFRLKCISFLLCVCSPLNHIYIDTSQMCNVHRLQSLYSLSLSHSDETL